MSKSIDLAEYAVRLRRFIQASLGEAGPASAHGERGIESASAAVFDRLALDLFAFQFAHNGPYRRLCEAREVQPQGIGHWTEIPAVPTSAFKELELTSLSAGERSVVFHSSGTTGQTPSRHFHSAQSLAIYEASALAWYSRHLVANRGVSISAREKAGAKGRLAILTPSSSEAPHSSLVHMFDAIRCALGFSESVFLGRPAEEGWVLDNERVCEVLADASKGGRPLMVLGTAFSFVHLLDDRAERGMRFRLPTGSRALETGGYKGRSRELSKPALHALMTRQLGLSPESIVCEYGMSELSSQAYDGVAGERRHNGRRFRFPPWARAQIISPETGEEAGEGETGLIRVLDLANVYSVMAVQTEDLGVRRGDGFELIGRATQAEARGCSLMALQEG